MQVRRLVPVLAVSVLATLIPTAAGAATERAAGVPVTDPLRPFTQQRPDFARCGPGTPADFECATVRVPLDYRAPGGDTLGIAVSRIKAADPAARRGVLLTNPGGPGGPGLEIPLDLSEMLPGSVKDRYDLIGFDPRGVGRSAPVSCGLTDEEKPWPRHSDRTTFDASERWARTVADKCRTAERKALRHITTRNTARDMDIVRAALGEKRISYLGYSYGTYLGAVYTQMFPRRADRFVLDSAVDPAQVWRQFFRGWAPESEKAFHRWARWTARHHDRYALGGTAAEVSRTFHDLMRRADREPVTIGGVRYDGVALREILRAPFFTPVVAADAVATVRDASAGRATSSALLAPEYPSDNELSSVWALLCGDVAWERDPARYRADSLRDAVRYPVYGDFAAGITPCAHWDRPVEPVTRVSNHVKALIVQNEWDSQTPLALGQGMRRAMKGARMVTVDEGEGHGVYGYGTSECAERAGTAYLTTGRLPAKDLDCDVNPAPAGSDPGGRSGPRKVPGPLGVGPR
ncbi:alpha/beta hydrolase [Streptomyces uncialis]|uniref:alpha/beta hydrolase n=1 Tax=Streptomyces uncialis TaxID=1048205 RepID=UPI0038705D9A|nr:alpha/beta hydrolase [Streptomyces uncialis]